MIRKICSLQELNQIRLDLHIAVADYIDRSQTGMDIITVMHDIIRNLNNPNCALFISEDDITKKFEGFTILEVKRGKLGYYYCEIWAVYIKPNVPKDIWGNGKSAIKTWASAHHCKEFQIWSIRNPKAWIRKLKQMGFGDDWKAHAVILRKPVEGL